MRKLNEQKAGVLLSYLNLALGSIIPLFYTPIMLGILGQDEYGLYSLSTSVTSYLTLLNLGMGSAIVRYVAKYRAENNIDGIRRLIGLFMALYSCMAVLVCIGGGVLSCFAGNLFSKGLTAPEIAKLKVLIIIMSLNVAISLPTSTFSSIATAYERFVFSRTVAICETVAVPVLNLLILYLGQGSIGMAVIALGIQVISAVIFFLYCSKKLNITPTCRQMPTDLLKEIASYCFFIFLSTIVDMLYWSTDKVLIGAILGSAMVAIYNVGGVFTAIMQNLAQAISQVFTPHIMMMATKKDQSPKEISELMVRIGRLQFYIVSFILAGYIVFGQYFINFWAGKGYEAAYYVALLTMVPLAIPLIQSIAYSTMVAQNKHKFRAIIYAIIAVANVVSTYLVLEPFGIIGAAVCTAVAFLLGNGIIMNIYYYKVIQLDIPGFWRNILKIAIVPVVMIVGGLLFVHNVLAPTTILVFLIEVAVFSVIFWVLNWLLSLNSYEKQLLTGILNRRG